ncbi:dihydropteroate synthase [Candidatus Latescibacterota bacterium]
MFTIVAERINMTRTSIREKVWERDEAFIRSEAAAQAAAGATHIDVNAGGNPSKEIADMTWLAGVVSDEVSLPLSLDSANPDAIRAGLEIANRPGTIVNSITLERERIENTLPLVREFNTGVICLTMSDEGMPEDYEGRVKLTDEAVKLLSGHGIQLDRVYLDHLVRPAATNPGQIRHLLDAVAYTRKTYPEAHVMVGLTNVSFGVPRRGNLNRAFLAMIVAAGADGAIIDPTDPEMMKTLYSARAVLGLDEYCMEYITKLREMGEA